MRKPILVFATLLLIPSNNAFTPLHHSSIRKILLHPQSTFKPTLSSSSTSLNQKLLSQDDLAKPPNQKVIDAIEKKLSSTTQAIPSIIASDISTSTGLSLSETKQSLSSIASLTCGDISVTNDGELIYTFPTKNISSTLRSNSLCYKLSNTWKKDIWPKLFWGIRIFFGVFLFVSIAAIFCTLMFILLSTSASSSDDGADFIQSSGSSSTSSDDRDSTSSDDHEDDQKYGVGDFLSDLFYPTRPYLYSTNYGYYSRYDPYYSIGQTEQDGGGDGDDDDEKRGSIFEGIFSYIFGDGDPNQNLEATRLREASRIIRANGGSVIAEQLAPFCDIEDPDMIMKEDFSITDEGFVLPIVSQLGGVPTVTEDGDIIYLFEDLQVTSNSKEEEMGMSSEMEYLQEMNVEFNRNENIGNIAAGALGVINLGGALYLGQILTSPAMSGVHQMAGVFGLVQAGYPIFFIYALLFNVIPAVRYVLNQKKNEEAKKRNIARRKWLTYLQVFQKVGGTKLKQKLSAAKSSRQRMKRLGANDVGNMAYDTRTKIEDLAEKKEKSDMAKFDESLLLKNEDDLGWVQ